VLLPNVLPSDTREPASRSFAGRNGRATTAGVYEAMVGLAANAPLIDGVSSDSGYLTSSPSPAP